MKPGRTFFAALLGLLFLGAGAFFFDTLMIIWIIAGAALVPLIVIDALVLAFFTDRLQVERTIPSALTLGRKALVALTVRRAVPPFLPGALPKMTPPFLTPPFLARSIQLFDVYPDTLECAAFPLTLRRDMIRHTLVFEYPVLPLKRGQWEFDRTELLLGSPLGFWQLKAVHRCESRGRTFPDFKKLASGNAELRGVLEQTGLKPTRKRGQGLDFMGLREYQQGDSVKHIDWRATGRRGKAISREYQEEQDQQVLLLLDSGYRLHRLEELPPRAGGAAGNGAITGGTRTQFDSALEAALLLSWVALKHHDGVGVGCFGAQERWLPPRKGLSALTALSRSLYDVQSASAPSSLFSALETALGRLKRRTFIIMISNFREEDGESLSWVLRRIRQRHLLLLVSLKEAEAEALAKRKPATKDHALETAAAFSYLSARKRLYKTWERQGLLTLECTSRQLSGALINRYVKVKRGGLL